MRFFFFFFQAEDGIRDYKVTGVQTCALPIWLHRITAPTLVLWGEADRANPLVYAEEWQRRGKGAAAPLPPRGPMVLPAGPHPPPPGGAGVFRPRGTPASPGGPRPDPRRNPPRSPA